MGGGEGGLEKGSKDVTYYTNGKHRVLECFLGDKKQAEAIVSMLTLRSLQNLF